jgi:hypothetical protein
MLRRRVRIRKAASVAPSFALTAADSRDVDAAVAAQLAAGLGPASWPATLSQPAVLEGVVAFHECTVRGHTILRVPARLNSGYVPGLGFMSHDAFVAVAGDGSDGELDIDDELVDVDTVARSAIFGAGDSAAAADDAAAGGAGAQAGGVSSDGTFIRVLPRVEFTGSGSLMSTSNLTPDAQTTIREAVGAGVLAEITARYRETSWPTGIATLSGRDTVRPSMINYVGFLEAV